PRANACLSSSVFFFQAEDGIRDFHVLEFRRVLFRSLNGRLPDRVGPVCDWPILGAHPQANGALYPGPRPLGQSQTGPTPNPAPFIASKTDTPSCSGTPRRGAGSCSGSSADSVNPENAAAPGRTPRACHKPGRPCR